MTTRRSAAWQRLWQRLRTDRRGAVAVEFGFAFPVLVLLTVGLVDFSLLLWKTSTVENAAAEGARFAIVNGASAPSPATAQDVEDYIRTQAVGVSASALNVNVTWDPNNQSGSFVTVALDYSHNFLVGGLIGLDPMTITKNARMIIF